MKNIKILIIFLILFLTSGCINNKNILANTNIIDNNTNITNNLLKIHYIDVGQGDSTFIELPNNETMLIDTGEREYYDTINSYINKLGYKKINYVIGTHPHTDHIGSLEYIVKNYDIENIYLPKASNNTQTFLRLLQSIKDKELSVNTAKSGLYILNNDDLKIKIIAPNSDSYENLNNYSIVIKIEYRNKSFLFMGDAEVLSEKEITDNVKSDVIKVGHHGSTTSSSSTFINKVKPKFAIISVGKNNSYNHPHKEIINRYKELGAKVYRTDELGTIVLESDGTNIKINDNFESNQDLNIDNKDENNKNSNIEIISLTDKVICGNNAKIEIKGKENTEYNIKVKYNSGYSNAKGLESKISDENGIVSFEWKVSKNVKSGIYDIIISDIENEYTYKFEVSEEE